MGMGYGTGTALLVLVCLFAAAGRTSADTDLNAAGPQMGIGCFGAETIDYRHPGKPSVKAIFG